jgi:hypothetical protein
MKHIIACLGFSFVGAPLALAQSVPEPLSFTGTPTLDSHALVDLSGRLGFFNENANGVDTDSNFNAFLFEGRFQANQQVSIYGVLPIVDLSQQINIGGLVINNEDTAVGNPELGALFGLSVRGSAVAAFGLGVGIPVLDNNDVAAVAGLVTNDINTVLFLPDIFALRPHFRFGGASGILSYQALLGLDLGFGVDNNNNDVVALRGGLNGGVAVAPSLSLMAELTFATDLDDNNNFDFATLHLGGRGQLKSGPNIFQPAFEFFLPIADDLDNLIEFGVSLSLRVML